MRAEMTAPAALEVVGLHGTTPESTAPARGLTTSGRGVALQTGPGSLADERGGPRPPTRPRRPSPSTGGRAGRRLAQRSLGVEPMDDPGLTSRKQVRDRRVDRRLVRAAPRIGGRVPERELVQSDRLGREVGHLRGQRERRRAAASRTSIVTPRRVRPAGARSGARCCSRTGSTRPSRRKPTAALWPRMTITIARRVEHDHLRSACAEDSRSSLYVPPGRACFWAKAIASYRDSSRRRYTSSKIASSAAFVPRRPATTSCAHSKYCCSRGRPVRGRRGQDVAQVADLVGQLHQLGLARDVRRVRDLELLALGLGQRLVVGKFQHDVLDRASEALLQLHRGGYGVLDRVVQQRRGEHPRVGDAAVVREQGSPIGWLM